MHLICGCGAEILADDMFGRDMVRDWQSLHKGCAVARTKAVVTERDADQCRLDYMDRWTANEQQRASLFAAIRAHRDAGRSLRTSLDILRS